MNERRKSKAKKKHTDYTQHTYTFITNQAHATNARNNNIQHTNMDMKRERERQR